MDGLQNGVFIASRWLTKDPTWRLGHR